MDLLRLSDAPDVLTVEQTRRVLGLGRNQVYEALARGQIRAVRIGRRFLVPKQALADLLGGTVGTGAVSAAPRKN